jgi:hypothetical protein
MEAFDGKRGVFRQMWKIDSGDEFANPAYYGEHAMETPHGWAG